MAIVKTLACLATLFCLVHAGVTIPPRPQYWYMPREDGIEYTLTKPLSYEESEQDCIRMGGTLTRSEPNIDLSYIGGMTGLGDVTWIAKEENTCKVAVKNLGMIVQASQDCGSILQGLCQRQNSNIQMQHPHHHE